MNYITLNNGAKIPQIALGVFQIPENEDAKKACLSAFKLGYRNIDSAHHYFNEAGVGAAVRECHPYFQQAALKERVKAYGTRMECWFPLGHGDANLINEPVFTELGKKYGKTNVQIILRWHIQEGNIPLPRSVNPEHQKQNLEIFDFSLTDEEMERIHRLDQGKRYWTLTLKQQEEKFLAISLAE